MYANHYGKGQGTETGDPEELSGAAYSGPGEGSPVQHHPEPDPGDTVLDAFAGTGNLGLEAWSRGAEEIVYFDKSRESWKLVKANGKGPGRRAGDPDPHGRGERSCHDTSRESAFDVIFSDPPYDKGLNRKVVEALEKWPVLKEGGLLVLEHSEENPADYLPQGMEFRQEKYGDTKISLIVWKS